MLDWFPYGDIWADVKLSSLWLILKNMKFKMAAMKSLKLYFEQQTIIFLSGTQ